MESVYEAEKFRNLYTKRLNVAEILKEYSEKFGNLAAKRRKKDSLRLMLNISMEECEKLSKICDPKQLESNAIPKSYVPKRRFKPNWALYDISSIKTSLATLAVNQEEGKEEKYKRAKSIRYPGQVVLENEKDKGSVSRQKLLLEKIDFLVCVRVMSVFGKIQKPTYQGSQEFLLPGRITLDQLKDRIICVEDYQAHDPVITSVVQPSPVIRKKDVNKNGMFYIDNKFYIDGRNCNEPGYDYSQVVLQWAEKRKISVGSVELMEKTKVSSLQYRLGFPYLYQHQGKCEHLIIFTDARLFNQQDNPYLEDYPIMITFAYLRGRKCILCMARVAKFIVKDCDILPYDNAFMCHTCSLSYLYDETGKKKSDFTLLKYVDRTALF